MKTQLLQKIIKYKYLYNLINKSKSSFSLFFLEFEKSSILNDLDKLEIKYFSLSVKFLKILISRYSNFYYDWLSMFKGFITFAYSFKYQNVHNFLQKIMKQNKKIIIFGGFIENKFFSYFSLLWLKKTLNFSFNFNLMRQFLIQFLLTLLLKNLLYLNLFHFYRFLYLLKINIEKLT